VANELSATVCSGITEVLSGDDSRSLLARADSALYSAKAAGPNRLFVHTGTHIRPYAVAEESANDARETTAAACGSSLQVVADDDNADADEAAEPVASGQQRAI
jgi:hypothetical protein